MLHPRPSDHASSPFLGRLPLALGATAVSLALVGCSYLPASLGGTAGEDGSAEDAENGEAAGQTDGAAPHDPTDAEGSIRRAVEHIGTAADYDVLIIMNHVNGDLMSTRTADHRYTNSPEEIVHTRLSGDGALHIAYYTGSEHTLHVSGDDYYAVVTEPTPADDFHSDPAVGAASLSQILETSTDLAYQGEGETEAEYTEVSPEGEYVEVRESIPAHGYGGTFTSTVPEIAPAPAPGSPALQLVEYTGVPFTLWLDGDGVPVTLEHTSGEFAYQHIFKAVNGGLELTMPAPGDPAFG